ncbi:hypothetical protein GP486_002722 [Trichoglossum hirsutum]|uniref:Rho GDP-dissociation inhibitor n=1 Tax=Trichoglossum hirsutum TaxID=265104 RepID=A0A9P8RRG0_9PEZI|nr:hypothetical protein GP486_002722 [Trichoglossum hirsutum]
MASYADDDLAPTKTEGFKLGEKKTVKEYTELDENDESLRRWKQSLGIGSGKDLSDPSDPRKAIILSLGLEAEGRPDIIIDLTAPGAVEALKKKPFAIKEGAAFRMKATFKVQHEVLSGLKYIQVVKHHHTKVRVSKDEEMIGSFSPNTNDKPSHESKFAWSNAPSGIVARTKYDVVSKFTDDDDNTHLLFEWSFEIKKSWE